MTLTGRSPPTLWMMLIVLSAVVTGLFFAIRLPAAAMLGPMIAGIILGAKGARMHVPTWCLTIAFGVIACMIGRTIDPALLRLVILDWPVFLVGALTVSAFGLILGVMMARMRLLPGTTAIWGSAPGGVTIMLVMAKEAGADVQLVAVMQFLRVVIVVAMAAVIALLFGTPGGTSGSMSVTAPAPFAWWPFLATLLLGTAGALLGQKVKIPGASMLIPMIAAILLSNSGVLVITQPNGWLIASYIVFGWSIGLGFTRETLIHARLLLPRIIAFILILMSLCAGLGYAVHLALGTDMLTAFLATSPAGLDMIAVIAASSHVDVSHVIGMQVSRFMMLSFVGPPIIAMIARRVERGLAENPAESRPAPVIPDGDVDLETAEPFE